jgi:hypothetical protein
MQKYINFISVREILHLPWLFNQGNSILEVDDFRHEEHSVQLLNVGVRPGDVLVEAAPGSLDVLRKESRHRSSLLVAVKQVSIQRPEPKTDGRNVVPAKIKQSDCQ